MNCFKLTIILIVTGLFVSSGSAIMIGGDRGWYEFRCHADGTKIYLDNEYVGDIVNGMLSVPIYTTGTPHTFYTATYEQNGVYISTTQNLPRVPGKGETVNIYVNIEPVPLPTPTPAPIGGDMGYFMIWSNEDYVTIYLDGEEKGMTIDGHLQIPVYTTGTPFTTLNAEKPGFIPKTIDITDYPEQGETVDIYVTMNPDIIVAISSGVE